MRWLSTALLTLLPITAHPQADHDYTDTAHNFRMAVPPGWTTAEHPDRERFEAAIALLPPAADDSSAIVVAVTKCVPELGPARLLARSDILAERMRAKSTPFVDADASQAGGAPVQKPLALSVVGEGPVEGGKAEGYRADYVVGPTDDGVVIRKPILLRRVAYFLSGERVYIIACTSETQEDFDRDAAAFDEVIGSFEIIGGQQPPPFEVVEGTAYRNPDLRFELRAPEGWILYRPPITAPGDPDGEARQPFTVLDRLCCAAPEGGTTVSLNVVRLPRTASAKEAVRSDNRLDEREAESYDFVSQGECEVNGLSGYQSVTQVTLMGAQRYRWRVYLESGDLLFPFVCDVVPPGAFEQQGKAVVGLVQSFKLSR
jgi:hypothetical protein